MSQSIGSQETLADQLLRALTIVANAYEFGTLNDPYYAREGDFERKPAIMIVREAIEAAKHYTGSYQGAHGCGCRIAFDFENLIQGSEIVFCSLHTQAQNLLDGLRESYHKRHEYGMWIARLEAERRSDAWITASHTDPIASCESPGCARAHLLFLRAGV